MGLDLKNSCRLCLNKEGDLYNLFDSIPGEITLADELKYLVNFQILKEDHLSDSICSNCYELNSFFKEFRIICAQVNDYVNQLHKAGESGVEEVGIRVEIINNDCNVTMAAEVSKLDDHGFGPNEECARQKNSVPPVSAFRLKCNEHLNELRSNFISIHELQDTLTTKITGSENLTAKYTSPNISELAKNVYNEAQDEIPVQLSELEENKNKKLLLRKDLFEFNQNSLITSYACENSESDSCSAMTMQNKLLKLSVEYPKEDSEPRNKNIPAVRSDLGNAVTNSIAVDLSAPPLEVQIKQEEDEIPRTEDDDFLSRRIPPYPVFDGTQYGSSPASISYYLTPQNRMGYVKKRRRLEVNPKCEFKRETPEQRKQRLEKDRLRKQQKRKLETAEERRMRLEYDRIRQQRRRAREREEMHINQVAYGEKILVTGGTGKDS